MAHANDQTTGQAAVFVTCEPAWHRLGTVIEQATTSAEAIGLAGLDWRVEQWPVRAFDPVRTDTRAVLGVVGKRYRVFQNHEAFDFMDSLVGDKLAMYETAGSLHGGKRVWMRASIPKEYQAAPDDLIKPYVLLTNTHDGSQALVMIPTTVRVVCQNTLNLALREAGVEGLTKSHHPRLESRIAEARAKLGITELGTKRDRQGRAGTRREDAREAARAERSGAAGAPAARVSRQGRGRVGASTSGGRRLQRVIVKTHVARHQPGKAKGSLTRHTRYLGRDSASADGKPGVFYDATQQGLSAKEATAPWAADRHHFRIIISPEGGSDIPDMTAFVRDVMARVEKDLGAAGVIQRTTCLQWIAINHHNTDNPHAHVVLRGRLEDGRDLVIPRAYLAHGIRTRASEVATELLGDRTVEQAREARLAEVEAERFTSLDRLIERHWGDGQVDLWPAKPIGFGAEDRQLVLARLQFLDGIELTHKEKGTYWSVDQMFGPALRELGARNDIIQQLYSNLGNEAGRVQRLTGSAEAPVAGIVIAKDQADELQDDRFIVIRDCAGEAHYGRVRDTPAYGAQRLSASDGTAFPEPISPART